MKYRKQYLTILQEELKKAMGCTEPIAIAFAAAIARRVLGCVPQEVEICVSGNIIKNVKSVSEELSYSEYYISHLFKKKMGITAKEYITKKKIFHACELLKTSPLGIEEISEHLNFASSHSFRRAFKSVTGISPREYKNNI